MAKFNLIDINLKAIKIISGINFLSEISWPIEIERKFRESLQKNKKINLKFNYQNKDHSEKKNALKNLLTHLSKDDPLHIYTYQTIDSYISMIDMVQNAGTPQFQEISQKEYGVPKHLLFGSEYSHLNTAKHFLDVFHDYDHPYIQSEEPNLNATDLKNFLEREAPTVLGEYTPKIEISKVIIAKVTAGRKRIRIRHDAKFSLVDLKNLLIHEVFTHTLTSINGSLQEQLPLMAYGAPRTTKTQEGLATFSEVITGLLDLDRLKRLSLRVLAIDMALDGADLYDLNNFFHSNGQSAKESFNSAARILRGGFPKGGIVFTKDGVYLEGLIRVHSFFKWAFKKDHLDLIHLLFAGRMDVNDVFLLREAYNKGQISHAEFLPDWYRNVNLLAGKMAFSLIANEISLKSVEDYFEKKFV